MEMTQTGKCHDNGLCGPHTNTRNRQRNPAWVHVDCKWNCFLLRHHTNCPFYFNTTSKRTVRISPPTAVTFDAVGCTLYPSHTVRSTYLWNRLLAVTWCVFRCRNVYFGVLTTATADYSSASAFDLRNIWSVYEKYMNVWDATWPPRLSTVVAGQRKIYTVWRIR